MRGKGCIAVEHNGKTYKSLAEAARALKISDTEVRARHRLGLPLHLPRRKALHQYNGRLRTVSEISEATGLTWYSVRRRLENGSALEQRAKNMYEFRGQMMTAEQIAEAMGYPVHVVYCRARRGMAFDAAYRRAPAKKTLEKHWSGVPYEHDLVARKFVREHPNGATLNEVGMVMGLSREMVRQIEARAMAKVRQYALRIGLSADIRDALRVLLSERKESYVDRADRFSIGGE